MALVHAGYNSTLHTCVKFKMAPDMGNFLIFLLVFVQNLLKQRINEGRMLIAWMQKRKTAYRTLFGNAQAPGFVTRRAKHGKSSHSGLVNRTIGRPRRRVLRSVWCKARPKLWWDTFQDCNDDACWRQHFRMGRGTFEYIVNSVRPYMERQVSNFRQPICVRKRVAVALWRLASGCDHRTIQELFGVSKSISCLIFHEFVTAITITLKDTFLHHPTEAELREIVQGFRDVWGFPQCAGSIDGTHIPILAPCEHRNDYFNRKGWYSVICQAVVDHRYLFWDIEVGWPGKVHDARVLANSIVFHKGQNGDLFPNTTERFHGVDVPIGIVADPAYPLQPWLMKPYPENPQSPDAHRYFNYRLSRARMTVECAFGRLKGRWRCLLRRNDTHIAVIPNLVLCCAVLHNICERRGEVFECDIPDGTTLNQPPRVEQQDNPRRDVVARAQNIRDALCAHLSANRF